MPSWFLPALALGLVAVAFVAGDKAGSSRRDAYWMTEMAETARRVQAASAAALDEAREEGEARLLRMAELGVMVDDYELELERRAELSCRLNADDVKRLQQLVP